MRPAGTAAAPVELAAGPTVGPLRAVLAALAGDDRSAGPPTVEVLAERTGLDPGVVTAAVDHLARRGRLHPVLPAGGCPASACGSCALAHGCG